MELIYTPGMITINETMVVVLVSFLVLVFVLNRIMFRPLLDTMQQRDDRMDQLDREIAASRQEAEALSRDLRAREDAARRDGFDRKKELESLASGQATQIMEASRQEIARMKEKVEQEVALQLEEAQKRVQKDAEDVAARIMEHILDRSVTAS